MPIRTERQFGVTATLTPEAQRNLMAIRGSLGWNDLLDVLEMVCIEKETELLNTPASDEAAVLANHKMAKVSWQMFTHFQEKVDEQITLFAERSAMGRPMGMAALSREEQEADNIVNPTHFYEDDAVN